MISYVSSFPVLVYYVCVEISLSQCFLIYYICMFVNCIHILNPPSIKSLGLPSRGGCATGIFLSTSMNQNAAPIPSIECVSLYQKRL